MGVYQKMDFLSPDQNYNLLITTQNSEWFLSNRPPPPCPNGFIMTTMSKGYRESGDRLAITNNQHAPNRYSNCI